MSSLTLNSAIKLPSGYSIPRLGFGVYRNEGDTCKPSVEEALKVGYRMVDTAQMYQNEAFVGAGLRASGLPRDQVFISFVSLLSFGRTISEMLSTTATKIEHKDYGYERTLEAVDESLKTMQIDYIDLFLIHEPYSGKQNRLATYRALLEAKKAGKIRDVGVSNFSARHIEEIREAGYELPAVNQIELHPFCQMKHVVPYCEQNGIIVQAFCPIVRGQQGDNIVLKELTQKYDKDAAQILVRWSLQKGYIPLPKSATPARIKSNADVYNFELTGDEMKRLDALDKGKEGSISWWPYDEP